MTSFRDAEIVAAYRDGAPQSVIAERFGLSQTRVCRILQCAGVPQTRGRKRVLPADPRQRRLYIKLRSLLGAETAGQEMGL